MTPRFLHFCILIALAVPAAVFGLSMLSQNQGSGAWLSGLGVVIGGAIFAGAVLYAVLSTVIVLTKVTSLKGVLAVHLAPFGIVALELARRFIGTALR